MESYVKFLLVATPSLIVGIPLYLAIFEPSVLSLDLFTSFEFWIPLLSILLVMLFGFWVGQQADLP